MMNDQLADHVARQLATRRPGHTLPRAFYNDADLYEFDLQAIFYRQWLFAGLEAELGRAGDYFTLQIGPSPIVVLRDKSGAIRAFHNTCRHRGSRICNAARGRSPSLVCPYHQWTYALDGTLVHARDMPATFDPAQYSLKPVHVACLSGTIYICLAETPPDFAPHRDAVAPLLAPHRLADTKVAADITITEKGNWKLVMENSRECYHCAVRHPELMHTLAESYDMDSRAMRDYRESCTRKGLKNGPVQGHGFRATRIPLVPGAVSITPDGKPAVTKLLGDVPDGDIGSLRWFCFPNAFMHVLGDYAFFFRLLPRGPMETEVNAKFLVHKDAVEGVDYDLQNLTRVWNVTNDQDRDLVEVNQLGVNSIGYEPGPYNPTAERIVAWFADWYVQEARQFLQSGSEGNPRR